MAEFAELAQDLNSRDMVVRQSATDVWEGVFQTNAHEVSPTRALLQTEVIGKERCTRLPDKREPVVMEEIEVEVDRAYTLPLGGQFVNSQMHLPVVVTTFKREASRRVYEDVANLMMYEGDIEQLFYTLLLRDLMDKETRALFGTFDYLLGDLDATDSTTATETGAVGYASVGTASDAALNHAMEMMPSTFGSLSPSTLVCNNITIWSIVNLLGASTVGDNLAEQAWTEGYATLDTVRGLKLMVTLNKDLYMVTEPKLLGRMYILEEETLLNDSKGPWVSLVLYHMTGGCLPNSGAFRKAYLGGSFNDSHVIEDLEAASV